MIEEIRDQCAVLYQFTTPRAVCDVASRGLRASLQHYNSKWWSNNQLISPARLSNFVLKTKQSLMEHFSVEFTVRISVE